MGINVCAPFLVAFTQASSMNDVFESIFFFFTFFFGTSIYFIPIPFIGYLNKYPNIKKIGRIASVIAAMYYLIFGIVTLA